MQVRKTLALLSLLIFIVCLCIPATTNGEKAGYGIHVWLFCLYFITLIPSWISALVKLGTGYSNVAIGVLVISSGLINFVFLKAAINEMSLEPQPRWIRLTMLTGLMIGIGLYFIDAVPDQKMLSGYYVWVFSYACLCACLYLKQAEIQRA